MGVRTLLGIRHGSWTEHPHKFILNLNEPWMNSLNSFGDLKFAYSLFPRLSNTFWKSVITSMMTDIVVQLLTSKNFLNVLKDLHFKYWIFNDYIINDNQRSLY